MRLHVSIVLLLFLLSGDLSSCARYGGRCYGCDRKGCSSVIFICPRNEDHCFTSYEPSPRKGCASKSYCEEPRRISGAGGTVSCCKGDLCNDAYLEDPESDIHSFMLENNKSDIDDYFEGYFTNYYGSVIFGDGDHFMFGGVQKVTQSFLLLCCSLLAFILII